ncbi:MAG TPA: hypothetical protein VHV51_01515 [Polyangiaceae bacterium]|nr:hypothetical protein [Polyangiaceae bacterium]
MRVRASKARYFASLWIALGLAALGCGRLRRASAGAACDSAGIVSTRTQTNADDDQVAAEIVQAGCDDCAQKTRPGAPAVSPCGAASVCAEACCACPGGAPKTYFRARVCSAGQCADALTACALARATIEPDVCSAATHSSPRNSSTAMP